ncbi:MAG: DUF4147 domain-containing protein [Acidobacteria bacterium]|nr:DUF4147 domain-containing protein [Acidobacteriota bacterium]
MTVDHARELCRKWFLETLEFVRPGRRLREMLRVRQDILEVASDSYSLKSFSEIRVVALGKAALEMAEATAAIFQGNPLRGIVAAPTLPPTPLAGFRHFAGGHPYPNEQSRQAADAVLDFLNGASSDQLVLFLISGGGSALLEKPLHPSVSLEDMRRFHEVLVTSGASIQEINILRKHVSAVKGGRLAERATPATQVTLYVSDVPEDVPTAVASGPTMPDESTLQDCLEIAARYGMLVRFPASIRVLLESGQLPETPKPGHPCFAKSRYHCLLSNGDAVEKLAALARSENVHVEVDSSCDEWDLQPAAVYLLMRLDQLRSGHSQVPVALVSGGELSCPVTGAGVGGRNQAFVLDCVPKIAGQSVVVLSAGTDGIDGNSPAAGAIADGASAERARSLSLDPQHYLRRSDSYRFFERLGDAIMTGPTGTNVRDVRILLAYPAR